MKTELVLIPFISMIFGCLSEPKEVVNPNQPVLEIADPVDSSLVDITTDLKIKILISKQKWGANYYSIRVGSNISPPKEYQCTGFQLVNLSGTEYSDYFHDTVCVVNDTIPVSFFKELNPLGLYFPITMEYAYPSCIENNRNNCMSGTSRIMYKMR